MKLYLLLCLALMFDTQDVRAQQVVKIADGSNNPYVAEVTAGKALRVDASATITGGTISVANFPSNQNVTVTGSALPIGAATEAKQDVSNTYLYNLNTALTVGKSAVFHVRNDYVSTPVTSAAYFELVASTPDIVNQLYIFDSSGQTLHFATGGAGSEVDQMFIVPGGNDIVNLGIAAGTRISIKAVATSATAGEIDVNAFK